MFRYLFNTHYLLIFDLKTTNRYSTQNLGLIKVEDIACEIFSL